MATQETASVTIANGGTVSGAVGMAGRMVAFGLQMPGAFTGTTVTFQVSIDGVTFQALYDSSGTTQVSMAVAASRSYDLPTELTVWSQFKIVSGSAEGADRTLVIIGKEA